MRMRQFLLLSLIILVFFTACTPSSDQKLERGNEVVVQIPSEPRSLHPTNGRMAARTLILYYTAQPLARLDPSTGKQAPMLARSLPEASADGLSFTYELDPAAQWADGRPITFEDVSFSLKAAACPLLTVQAGRAIFEQIKDLVPDAENDRRFTVQMREKYAGNPFVVNDFFIIDKRFFDPKGLLDEVAVAEVLQPDTEVGALPAVVEWAEEFNDAKYNNKPEYLKGTSGPYEVESWTPGQQIVLKRRENYWGAGKKGLFHQQYPDKIVFVPMREESVIELQVKQQKVDVATQLSTQTFNALQQDEKSSNNYYIDYRPRNAYTYIGYNLRPDGINHKPIFDDKRVRRAFAYATPVEEIIEAFYQGQVRRVTSPVSPVNDEYNRQIEPIPLNLDSARVLLDQAGWIDSDGDLVRDKMVAGERIPLSLGLVYPAGQQALDDIVQRIISSVEEVGFQVEPKPTDFRLLGGMLVKHDFDAIMVGASSSPLPYDFKQMWSSGNWETGENFTGFGSIKTDSLIEIVRHEIDPVKRKELMDEMQEIIYEEQPVTFFFNSANRMAIHRRFENAEMYEIMPYILLNNLKLKN
jgi:peptide/nickel transport system substrate-binding protein